MSQLPLISGFDKAPEADARRVLAGIGCPWPITDMQRELLKILVFHIGASRAVPLRHLMGRLRDPRSGICPSNREIKDAVRSLVVDFKVKIGASRMEPYGYYLIANSEEALATARPYIAEIKKLTQRIRVLLDAHEFATQLRLDQPEETNTADRREGRDR